jgi:hypothetical protein
MRVASQQRRSSSATSSSHYNAFLALSLGASQTQPSCCWSALVQDRGCSICRSRCCRWSCRTRREDEALSSVLRAAPAVVSVSMHDMGTEMTPMASQEQSWSGTPASATTSLLSPLCSVQSRPRFEGTLSLSPFSTSEREQGLRLMMWTEIIVLSLQLIKMNITSWYR